MLYKAENLSDLLRLPYDFVHVDLEPFKNLLDFI